MHRVLTAAWAACALAAFTPAAARAQSWNDPRSRELVERATARRAQQLADTGLKDYKAIAHGYVTFLAQMGEGLAEPPKVVKADELVNEVYWLAPNMSKQRILGRRDTLLLPTDIAYHRDHLGIVQNNFPAIIRLGDGDEVVDVPHPLSPAGLAVYDFAIADSLPLNLPGRTIMLYQVKVRPKDDRQARVIGAVYIDRDDAQVVRMALNFTRAAFRDPSLEDLFVIVENGLIGGRFWLPRRQEIEIRRGGTWLDYPVRGIIRGRWEIGDYEVNVGLPRSFFTGPEIVLAPKAAQDTFHFSGRVLDSLPSDVRAVTDADIRQVQAEARALVRAQALQRPQTLMLSAASASDFARYDRAEGLALGGGLASRFGGGVGLQLRARYGVDDHTAKGSATLEWQSPRFGARVLGFRDYREAGDVQERSGIVNSLAAQEFGADVTNPYGIEGFGVGLDARDLAGGLRLRLNVTRERQYALTIRATSASGTFPPLIPATPVRALRFSLVAERPTALSVLGSEIRASGELRVSRLTGDEVSIPAVPATVGRAFASITATRPFGGNVLALQAFGGAVGAQSGVVPPQEWLYFGGPVSAPGYRFAEFATLAGATTRLEWRTPIPAPAFSLGRFGKVPGVATLAPFVQATFARPALATDVTHPTGVYPAAGVALQPFFDLLRFQLAHGLRNGSWTFDVDVTHDFWGIL